MGEKLDPPATAEELAWAEGPGRDCACTGRCRLGPHFTCTGKPRDEERDDIIRFLRRHPEIKT